LIDTQQRLGLSWKRLALHLGVSLPALYAARTGRVPQVETVRRMTEAAGADQATSDQLLEWVSGQQLERSIRRNARARCRVCGGWEMAYKVRARGSYVPPHGAEPASFVHKDCEQKPSAKVKLVCPEDGCGAVREVYWSARRKAAYAPQLGADGTYSVRCKRHNLVRQGQRQTARMKTALFDRFASRFEQSRYAEKHSADEVWTHYKRRMRRAREIVWEVTGFTPQPQARRTSPTRGPRISEGQILKRWARELTKDGGSRRSRWQRTLCDAGRFEEPRWEKCNYCPMCGKFIFGGRYHTSDYRGRRLAGPAMCWEAWRATPEYKRTSGRGRRPIDPPTASFMGHFMGRPPSKRKTAQKLSWFLLRLAGESRKALALAAGVPGPDVTTGIEDFLHRMPADYRLAGFRKKTGEILQRRFPLRAGMPDLRGPGDERRILWLTRWKMPGESIERLLGYSIPEQRAILARPVLLGSALVRLARTGTEGLGWCTEAWNATGWRPAAIPVMKVLEEGQPASAKRLDAFGLPPTLAKRAGS
jgi:hypothetical protein